MNKKWFIFTIILTVAIVGGWLLPTGQSKTKSYYSGDIIDYHGQILVGTTNTGSLEVFKLVGNQLQPALKFKTVRDSQSLTDSFTAMAFNQEGEQLYIYAAAGNVLSKYDFSDLQSPVLTAMVKDTTWDWFGQLDRFNGYLVTVGSKSVRLWNDDLQVVDSFRLLNQTNPYNIRLAKNNRFIYNLNAKQLEIFDRDLRGVVRKFDIVSNAATGNRQPTADGEMIYLIDDRAVKQFSVAGDLYKTLKHDSGFGYDVLASGDNNYLYVTNGTSVAKLNKGDFSFAAGLENRDLKIAGSWFMGLARTATAQGEVLAVFNNSNILVVDSRLKVLARVMASETDTAPSEDLFLKLDRPSAAPWSEISLRGGGYGPNEKLNITFADRAYEAPADANGRFSTILVVPAINSPRAEIKVVGAVSGRHYSTSFIIEGNKE